jgi:redox-sensing transcriptional repressor
MPFSRQIHIPAPTIRRLSLYFKQLEQMRVDGMETIRSRQLGQSLGLTDAQIRRDLAHFGTFGHPGVGYNVEELIDRLRRTLGTDHSWTVALVGVGNLGRASLPLEAALGSTP